MNSQFHQISHNPILPQSTQKNYHQTNNLLTQSYLNIEKKLKSNSKTKFDIRKFEKNILKEYIQKTKQKSQFNKNIDKNKGNKVRVFSLFKQNLLTKNKTYQNLKQIQQKRKLSRDSRSKSRKQLQLKKKVHQNQIFQKIHLTNNSKILRQKIILNLSQYDDYKMINIQDSIPILNHAGILKLLTSIQETKQKIKDRNLSEGRIKQQAKFIYFLWKMINEEEITTRHLKQIVLLLNQLNKNEMIETMSSLYSRQNEIIRMFVDCWMKLKLDKFFYQHQVNKDKIEKKNQSKINSIDSQISSKSSKRQHNHNRCKTQYINLNDVKVAPSNQQCQQTKQRKFIDKNHQKKLVQRLYEQRKDFMNKRQRIKTLNDQEKENQQIQKCTFKPVLNTQTISRSSSGKELKFNSNSRINQNIEKGTDSHYFYHNNQKSSPLNENLQRKSTQKSLQKSRSTVKGFEKAVNRLKQGHNQTKKKQELINYYSVGQNYEKLKSQGINPPKFLSRQKNKKQDIVLFVIQFQIGRHKVKIKIHPTDTQTSVARKISKIYGLKPDEQQEIKEIISMQLNLYYKKIGQSVSQFIEQ